jgi:hypothetical protein
MKIESRRPGQGGFAVLIALLLLGLMVGFVMANTGALYHLKREVKNVERRHELRWKKLSASATNAPPANLKK